VVIIFFQLFLPASRAHAHSGIALGHCRERAVNLLIPQLLFSVI